MISFEKLFFTVALVTCAIVTSYSQPYTIVFLNKNTEAPQATKEEVDKIMQGHSETRERLAKEGKLLAAGPFDGGGGIYIMKTGSTEEASSWIANDPGIQAKRWNIEIKPYQPRQGGICPVGEKYTMTSYTFVLFTATVRKATATNFPELIRQHDEYLKQIAATGNVVTEAIFGQQDGGILILKGDADHTLLDSDPAVEHGLIQYEVRKFYTAKGAFCEQ